MRKKFVAIKKKRRKGKDFYKMCAFHFRMQIYAKPKDCPVNDLSKTVNDPLNQNPVHLHYFSIFSFILLSFCTFVKK
jgi:hypothetical protein